MRRPFARSAVAAAIVLCLGAGSALAAGSRIEVQGFGGPPAAASKQKLARRASYAAAVALALYELAEQAHSAVKSSDEAGTKSTSDFTFAKGLRVQGWVRRSQALDTDSDLSITLPKSRVWGEPLVLHVLKSALVAPAPEKISTTRLRWTLTRNGIRLRHVEYSDDNWATVNLSADRAKLEKLTAQQAAQPSK